jgi:hypothetical protein
MSDKNTRAEDARRHDDHRMIDGVLKTPSQSGRSGGNLQRDIGTRAEEEHLVDGKTGVTRVLKADEPD